MNNHRLLMGMLVASLMSGECVLQTEQSLT